MAIFIQKPFYIRIKECTILIQDSAFSYAKLDLHSPCHGKETVGIMPPWRASLAI